MRFFAYTDITDRLVLTSDPANSPSDPAASGTYPSPAQSKDHYAKHLESIFGTL